MIAFYPITPPDHEGKSTAGKRPCRPAREDAPILRWEFRREAFGGRAG
jgi:hypothetical protein